VFSCFLVTFEGLLQQMRTRDVRKPYEDMMAKKKEAAASVEAGKQIMGSVLSVILWVQCRD